MARPQPSRRSPVDALAVLAALDEIRAAVDALRDLVAAGDLVPPAPVPLPAPAGDWRKLKDAARELQLHPETLARQARKHGFGRRVPGGSWRIDLQRYAAWIEGRPFNSLVPEEVEKCRKMSDEAGALPAAK